MLEILLVDDDELVRQSLEMLLTHEGFAVRSASGGRQALELARLQLFDLVVCDVRMPDMDGLETVAALREHLPEAHFMLVTGFASEDAPVEALRLKVDDYLRKPFDLSHFLGRVRQLRRQRRQRSAPPPEAVLQAFTEQLRRRPGWGQHVDQAEELVTSAAQRLGLPEVEQGALRLAARLHDLVRELPAGSPSDEEPLSLLERAVELLVAPDSGLASQILTGAVQQLHGGSLEGLDPRVAQELRRAAPAAPEPMAPLQPEPALRFYTLGETRLLAGGQPAVFESARARWLLLYLASRRGQAVPQERLRDLFWPASDADKAQRALISSVHRIKKALELPELVVRGERGYGLNPAVEIWWDLDQLERAAREGRASQQAGRPEEAVRAFRLADSLYRGEFCPECPEEWAQSVRDQALRCAVDCAERLATLLLERDPALAEDRARRALALEPTSETACIALLRALGLQQRRDEAVRLYHQFGKTLERELDLPPGPELTRAYLELTG